MQLLCSRGAPVPEFVSLSILLKDEANNGFEARMRDPLLLPSPVSTISHVTCLSAIHELHQYLASIHKAAASTGKDTVALSLIKEDHQLMSDTQVFRPYKGQGIGLHYCMIQDRSAMLQLVQLVNRATSDSGELNVSTRGVDKEVLSVVLTVGMVGVPLALGVSTIHASLSQRIKDCIDILSRTGTDDVESCTSLLASTLLNEDENRVTNSMAMSQDYHLFAEANNKRKGAAAGMDPEFENPLSMNSADQGRVMVERFAVLSVSEKDTILKKFDGKALEKTTKSRRRKAGKEADLDGFDFRGEPKSSTSDSVSDASSIKSSSSKLQLKQPTRDTARIGGPKARTGSVPALSASNKDTGVKLRRPPGDQSSRNSRSGSRRQSTDAFQSNSGNGQSHGSANSFDPFGGMPTDSMSVASESSSSRKPRTSGFETHGSGGVDGGFFGDAFGTGRDIGSMPSGRSRRTHSLSGGGEHSARVLVNVALNEDLICIYKSSKLTSCAVEGVIQVQVKSTTEDVPSFLLSIQDPTSHIMAIQENAKFAEESTSNIDQSSYNFVVSVPKEDSYFPVMRYKCGDGLRPVPIRVQTRVRLEGEGHCRVALQISSNPHNEDNLTDLTIIMGVPPMVLGESLTTSPAGGVWNASKRSVIWCVSELGGGEKFQLQARFEVEPDSSTSDETPKFPVLVRCKCMHNQLSDVGVEVSDIPNLFPADVRMKVVRQFRLSHRERP